MKHPVVLTSLVAVLLTTTTLVSAKGQNDIDMGLSHSSVFTAPAPDATIYPGKPPGGNQTIPKSYATAPPMIPHSVAGLVPVTIQNNACLGCHNNQAMIGKPKMQGMPTPMPQTHYIDPRDGKVSKNKPTGARYVCTQCHAPQANAKSLVGNDFKGDNGGK